LAISEFEFIVFDPRVKGTKRRREMADEQASNPSNQGETPQHVAPQQPATQQPPPPPPNAAQIIAAQQAAIAQQIAAAQARDRAQFGPAAEGVQPGAPMMGGFAQAAQAQQGAAQGVNLPQGQTAQQVAQGAQQPPQQVQYTTPPTASLSGIPNPAIPQTGGMQPPDLSGLPDPSVPQNGVTVQQLAQGARIQGAPMQGQPQQQQQRQESDKPVVRWHPGRNSSISIEMGDSIITGIPDSIEKEPDPQAKVVAALFSEILSLRARLDSLEQGGSTGAPDNELASRVYNLEMTLYEQRQALNQGARALREEAERQAILEQQAASAAQATPSSGDATATGGDPPDEK